VQYSEPPFSPEDTKPTERWTPPSILDTQPIGDTRPLTPTRGGRSPLTLLVLAATAASAVVILIIGGLLFLLSPAENGLPITVYLQVQGETFTVSTTASTIRQLLEEQQITVYENTVIAPHIDTRLSPDMSISLSAERSVSVTIDGETSIFRTVFDHPLDILESVGFTPDRGDRVQVDGTTIEVANLVRYPLSASEIIIQNAVPITITTDGETLTFDTTAQTVGDALTEAGITLFLGDAVTPDVETTIQAGMEIVVERSTPIKISVDGATIETRAVGLTVGDALNEAGVVLTGLDYAIPPESTRLNEKIKAVRVVRVTESVETEQRPVAYETVYQADAEMELDQQAVIQTGVNGIEQQNIRVRYEDGEVVNRTDEGFTVTQAPVDQIVAYGTKIVLRTLETPEGTREYWRKLRVYATSYHPAALGGDDVTATGRKLQKGIVGIDPKLIPYDTNVYVEGYGTGVAADTGGPRRSRYWIDLGYSDADFVGWSRWVDVYLLTPVPEDIPYILPPR
jgi:resuscitation-promoting factor RpfB